jgi:DNA ligase-1
MSDPCQHIITSLEDHNSRLNKEAIILAQAEQNNQELFEGFKLALDPMITFGVKKVPEHGGPDGQGLPWTAFRKLADQLAGRELTGNDAKKAIEFCLGAATKSQWNNWYRRILIKDLRCGVSEKTVNNVVAKKYNQFSVPVFSCQLAHDSSGHEKKVCGKKLIQVKLDGVRILTIVYPDGRVDQYSRNGKELVNFELIKEQFVKTVTGITEPIVFDGEIMSSSFQDLMKQVHRKSDVAADDAVLHLFDYIPLKDFQQGLWNMPQTHRLTKLKAWKDLWAEETPNIQILGYEEVDLDSIVGQVQYREINQRAINGGYEGIMIKDPNASYECKRTTSWLKLKPFIEVSLTVTAVEEGTGRNVGKLGALVCEGEDDGKAICVNVGSGFSDVDRDSYWISCEEVVGKVVEVRADAITQNQDGTYSLRFPRFLRFRGFDNGEKI